MKLFPCLFLIALFYTAVTQSPGQGSCENSCVNGRCVSNKCICDDGWFDTNCDTFAYRLSNGQVITQNVNSGDWVYFYFPLDNIDQEFRLKIETEETFAKIYTLFQGKNSFKLANNLFYNNSYFMTSSGSGYITFTKREIKLANGGKLTIGFRNYLPWSAPIDVELQLNETGTESTSSTSSMAGIIIGVVVGILVIFTITIITICVRRQIHRYHTERIQREQSFRQENGLEIQPFRGNPQPQVQVQVQVPPRNIQVPRIYLTAFEIEEFFPKDKFGNMKKSFPQTSCSICLDDFLDETECHQLYCEHIFHDICIQKWLSKHDSCPDCRKTMTKEAIKTFFDPQKLNPNQNQALPQPSSERQDFYAPNLSQIWAMNERGFRLRNFSVR